MYVTNISTQQQSLIWQNCTVCVVYAYTLSVNSIIRMCSFSLFMYMQHNDILDQWESGRKIVTLKIYWPSRLKILENYSRKYFIWKRPISNYYYYFGIAIQMFIKCTENLKWADKHVWKIKKIKRSYLLLYIEFIIWTKTTFFKEKKMYKILYQFIVVFGL